MSREHTDQTGVSKRVPVPGKARTERWLTDVTVLTASAPGERKKRWAMKKSQDN